MEEVSMRKLGRADQVAVRLDVDIQRVYELTRRGQLPAIKLGERQYRYDMDRIEEWIKRGGATQPQAGGGQCEQAI